MAQEIALLRTCLSSLEAAPLQLHSFPTVHPRTAQVKNRNHGSAPSEIHLRQGEARFSFALTPRIARPRDPSAARRNGRQNPARAQIRPTQPRNGLQWHGKIPMVCNTTAVLVKPYIRTGGRSTKEPNPAYTKFFSRCIWLLCGFGFLIDLMWAQAFGLVLQPLEQELGFAGSESGNISVGTLADASPVLLAEGSVLIGVQGGIFCRSYGRSLRLGCPG